jgi:FAD synthase
VLPSLPRGVYAGWAQVDDGAVYACVLSLGTNPTFGTKEETLEAYILHSFESDFYSHRLSLIIVAFIRPQYSFSSIDQLIAFIRQDVQTAEQTLQQPHYARYQHDPFFHSERSIRSSV